MHLDALAQKFASEKAHADKLELFNSLRELLYPSRNSEVVERIAEQLQMQ
jgi:hypothetical protein